MATTRSVLHVRDSSTLELHYAKRNPATGTYYTDTGITACTVAVYGADGSVLLAPTAMTYVANLHGYRSTWTYGTALNGRDIAYLFFSPSRAATVAAALAPDEIVPVDLSALQERLTAVRASRLDNLDAAISSRMATFALPVNFSVLAINTNGHVVLQDASLVTAKLGNFVLAKTTHVTGFNDLNAAGVRAAVGLASANLDGQLDTIGERTANLPDAPAATGDAMTLTSAERDATATALLDLANGVEIGKTLRHALRLIAAALAGKRASSGTVNETYSAIGNPSIARIVGNLDVAGDGEPVLTP